MNEIQNPYQPSNSHELITDCNTDKMKTASRILQEYEDKNEFHFHEVDREWIIKAMELFGFQSYEAGSSVYVRKVEGANMLGVADFQLSSKFKDYEEYLIALDNKQEAKKVEPAHDDTTAPCQFPKCKRNRYRLGMCRYHYNLMPTKCY